MAGIAAFYRLTRQWRELFGGLVSHFIPPGCSLNAEALRRARLNVAFAILGGVFGLLFAAFYAAIGHPWGAAIIIVCCAAFAWIPFILRASGSCERAGNFYCLILNIGFFCLCLTEGGIRGHALAWLVTVPLLALLLASRRAAYVWCLVASCAAAAVVGAEFTPYPPPILYPPEWHNIVSGLGYLSLVAFMFILGLLSETGLAEAQAKMLQALNEIAEANQHLRRLNDEKNEFLGIAAHDLKNPLTVVMTYSDMILLEHSADSRLKRFASAIKNESTRMRDLISNLLDLNAIESGASALQVINTDLTALASRAVDNERTVAAGKEITLALLNETPLWAQADANALLQILDNLISNAIKFSKPNTSVTVELRPDGNRALIEVADQGPGISPSDRAKLFKRFSKLSARPTGGESSNGLGLSIVKRLVEGMNGSIECVSELGHGTKFIVSLKTAAPAPNMTERSSTLHLESIASRDSHAVNSHFGSTV